MGVLSAIGFSTREIARQIDENHRLRRHRLPLGVLFAATAGEAVVGGLISMSSMGIAQLSFIINPDRLRRLPLAPSRRRVIPAHLGRPASHRSGRPWLR
ncbi:MAG: hypothetical protein R2722_01995 [Tessaracoccus sp.]